MTKRYSIINLDRDYHVFVLGEKGIAFEFNVRSSNAGEALGDAINRWENTHQEFFNDFKGIRIREYSDKGKIVCEIGSLEP